MRVVAFWQVAPRLPDTGKSIGNVTKFSVDENYFPTGKMGDTGDLSMSRQEGFIQFTYTAEGHGPHEWDYQFVDGKENPDPAQFAGYMYLEPQNNWGTDPEGGYDLQECHHTLRWEARSADGEVSVEFVIGGDKRRSDSPKPDEKTFPYPNSINKNLGAKHLTTQWQEFPVDLSSIPNERFKRIVGGFGWVITWDANGVKAKQPKKFTIEIRNIRYEK